MAYIQKEYTMIFFIIEIRTAQVWKETDRGVGTHEESKKRTKECVSKD